MDEYKDNNQEEKEEIALNRKLKQRIIAAIIALILSIVTLYFFVIKDYYDSRPNDTSQDNNTIGDSIIDGEE